MKAIVERQREEEERRRVAEVPAVIASLRVSLRANVAGIATQKAAAPLRRYWFVAYPNLSEVAHRLVSRLRFKYESLNGGALSSEAERLRGNVVWNRFND